MIALSRHITWNVYISRDENDFYRRDALTDDKLFGEYAIKKGWEIVAGLEDLSEEEKDGLFGFYDDRQEEEDHLSEIVRKLNNGVPLDPQKSLEDEYILVYRKLEQFYSEYFKH